MDINWLRRLSKGEDSNYKTMLWNLSQNVDRSTGEEGKPGICPCLTPNMVPYLTNRGGPLIGQEVLSLQGIPVDDLLLTRESSAACQQSAPPRLPTPPKADGEAGHDSRGCAAQCR